MGSSEAEELKARDMSVKHSVEELAGKVSGAPTLAEKELPLHALYLAGEPGMRKLIEIYRDGIKYWENEEKKAVRGEKYDEGKDVTLAVLKVLSTDPRKSFEHLHGELEGGLGKDAIMPFFELGKRVKARREELEKKGKAGPLDEEEKGEYAQLTAEAVQPHVEASALVNASDHPLLVKALVAAIQEGKLVPSDPKTWMVLKKMRGAANAAASPERLKELLVKAYTSPVEQQLKPREPK